MADWFSRIESALKINGFASFAWSAGDGRLLLMPHGARILGCDFPGLTEENLFWHDPALEDPRRIMGPMGPGGIVMAGDRLWIAPEFGFMWPDLASTRATNPLEHYRVLPSMDPGDYRVVESSAGHLRLVTEMSLQDGRFQKRIRLRAGRQFDLSQKPDGLPEGLRCVSFLILNELTLLEADAGTVAGAWDLLQLRAEGELICPTLMPVAAPRRYFGTFPDPYVRSDAHAVRYRIDGKWMNKMGLSPTQTTGRMGYYRRLGNLSALIVRLFAPLPGEPYVDLPLESEGLLGGDALQAYNDGGQLGAFGEMEHHAPALVAGKTPATRSSSCITHVLIGADMPIRQAGRMLLGVEL